MNRGSDISSGCGGPVCTLPGIEPLLFMAHSAEAQTIEAAQVAATAAGVLLSNMHRLSFAVSDPDHRGLPDLLVAALPACTALGASFPTIRTRVAGLVYQSVKHAGYTGSSALHIVAQIAELIAEIAEPVSTVAELSPEQLERLATDVGRALPSSLDDEFRTHLDSELAALERELGAEITGAYNQMERPASLARIGRMLRPYLQSQTEVVLAPSRTATEVSEANGLQVEFESDKLAIVTEGQTVVQVRGERRVWVFRQVVEMAGQTVLWRDLVQADMRRAADRIQDETSGANDRTATPRFATTEESFRRMGRRIREDLRKLAYHWHQDVRGARWYPEIE